MVIIRIKINRKVKLELIKYILDKLIFHNSNLEKQAVPIIHKLQYIGRIKSANNNSNIIKLVKLRHYLQY